MSFTQTLHRKFVLARREAKKINSQDNESVDTAIQLPLGGDQENLRQKRVEKVKGDVERIDKDVTILKNNLSMMD